ALWRSFGARVVEMDPQEHDTLFALISHLPHLLAFSTMGLSLNKSVDLSLVGSGFLDSTRLAQCPPSLWVDIAIANSDALALTLEAFIGELQDLEVNLRAKDAESLAFKFHRAHQLRISMEAS
ncbi:MAG: prephenate dehydrogenase/arogenate dehydrogenase family protein, partial [Holophaga sp.]|nr:prephenate dehydrogenase/arogenate dehydrogenase family protein [Holophaga sp.]